MGTDLTFGSLTLAGGDPVDGAYYEVSMGAPGEAPRIWYGFQHTAGTRFKVTGIQNTLQTLPVTLVNAISAFSSNTVAHQWLALIEVAMSNPASLVNTLTYATPRYTGTPIIVPLMVFRNFQVVGPFRVPTYSAVKNKWELSWRAAFSPAEA